MHPQVLIPEVSMKSSNVSYTNIYVYIILHILLLRKPQQGWATQILIFGNGNYIPLILNSLAHAHHSQVSSYDNMEPEGSISYGLVDFA